MDVNRESKYVKRVPSQCQEGVKDSEFVKSLGFLSRLKRFNVLRGFQIYVKSCEEGVKSCEEGHSVKSCGEGVESCEEGVKSCQEGSMRVTVSRRCQRVVKILPRLCHKRARCRGAVGASQIQLEIDDDLSS